MFREMGMREVQIPGRKISKLWGLNICVNIKSWFFERKSTSNMLQIRTFISV